MGKEIDMTLHISECANGWAVSTEAAAKLEHVGPGMMRQRSNSGGIFLFTSLPEMLRFVMCWFGADEHNASDVQTMSEDDASTFIKNLRKDMLYGRK